MSASTSRTFAEERRTAIMDMLEHSASVQVADIAQAFGVSTVTARGDLDALAAAGKLRRTHGGAVSLHKTLTVSVQDQRVNVNVDAKQSIARAALELVRDGDTVFVDSGTTALEFVRMLDMRTGITVITADITIADYIDESLPSVDVIMLGGELRKGHRYLFGPLTMAAIATIHADLAVICPAHSSQARLCDRLPPNGGDQASRDERREPFRRPHGRQQTHLPRNVLFRPHPRGRPHRHR